MQNDKNRVCNITMLGPQVARGMILLPNGNVLIINEVGLGTSV